MLDQVLSAEETLIADFRIGSHHMGAQKGWKVDLSEVETTLGFTIHGLIGADLFEEQDLLIDYLRQEILLVGHSNKLDNTISSSTIVKLTFSTHFDNLPVVEVNYNGKRLSMAFDTGAGISLVDQGIYFPSNTQNSSLDINIGQLKLEKIPVRSIDMSLFVDNEDNRLDGVISAHSFNANQILISTKRKSIFLFL